MKISAVDALETLKKDKSRFVKLFEHGTLQLEVYQPEKIDNQTPHLQNEVYIVISGSGEFLNNGERTNFGPGDFLFVPAGVEHRFENFTDDFATWVIFYGPVGGEKF